MTASPRYDTVKTSTEIPFLWLSGKPPLDPALLVSAVAQGLSFSSVLNDLNAPTPIYRFFYLLQKALELCSEIRSMGDKFLLLKEKRDSLAGKNYKNLHRAHFPLTLSDAAFMSTHPKRG
jgi:hypothetical protein